MVLAPSRLHNEPRVNRNRGAQPCGRPEQLAGSVISDHSARQAPHELRAPRLPGAVRAMFTQVYRAGFGSGRRIR
jgi:hypothetical protein